MNGHSATNSLPAWFPQRTGGVARPAVGASAAIIAMNTIDYVYRFNPRNPSVKPPPRDAASARRTLEDGNRLFARWMESCRTSGIAGREPPYVVQCNGLEVGMNRVGGEVPEQSPFAVVVGCSDARVPTEMLFGQGFNDLFVIRVAGNVLGDVCMGSIQFALEALHESVRCLVILGHLGCGAVTAAVDCYLSPLEFWSDSTPSMLRTIIERIFVAVREADNGIKESWGSNAREIPGFRGALIDTAVCLNAAHAAFDLRQVVAGAGRNIEVLFGVYSLHTHQVSMPVNPRAAIAPENVNLAVAPAHPQEFHDLARRVAELSKPRAGGRSDRGDSIGTEPTTRERNGAQPSRDLIGWELNSRPL
jgi:carbonic anhydrase